MEVATEQPEPELPLPDKQELDTNVEEEKLEIGEEEESSPVLESPTPIVEPMVETPIPEMQAVAPPVKPRPKRIIRPIYSKLRLKAKCHLCGHYFKRSCLGRHLKYVHGEMVVQCTICKRCFNRPDSARHHVTLHHKIDTARAKEFLCDVKKRDLPEEEVPPLRRRGQVNTVEVLPTIKAFNCYDCDLSFNSVTELFNHCEVHRFSDEGQKYRFLIPLKLRPSRNPSK